MSGWDGTQTEEGEAGAYRADGLRGGLQCVRTGLAGGEGVEAGEDGGCDVVQSFVGQESLVAGNDDVGVGDEAGEERVGDAGVAVVVEEEGCFVFVDVEAESAQAVVLECFDGGARVDESAAAGVDEKRGGLQAGEGGGVDKVFGRRKQRTVERHDVGAGEEIVASGELEARGAGLGGGKGIECEDVAAEALEDFARDRADAAGADEAGGFAVEVEALESVETEVTSAHAVVGEVRVAVEREKERDGVFGDCVRRVGGDVGDGDAERGGGGEIYLVVAGATEGDEARAAGGQSFQRRGVERIVDERADGFVLAGERCVVRGEASVDPGEPVGTRRVGGGEVSLVVGTGAVDGDFHAGE